MPRPFVIASIHPQAASKVNQSAPTTNTRDGAQALAIATRRTPAAIVLDYGLPDADAAALVNAIRAVCERAVAVVLITAGDNLADKARAVGAADYLRKPFDLDDLTRGSYADFAHVA